MGVEPHGNPFDRIISLAGVKRELDDFAAAVGYHNEEGHHREIIKVRLPPRGKEREPWLRRKDVADLMRMMTIANWLDPLRMTASLNGQWIAPRDRKAWHEIGHVAVAFYLVGHVIACELGMDGEDARTIIIRKGPIPRTADEWLAAVAYSHGGRAAVRWAIENGRLTAAPEAESVHGDHGFFGEGGRVDHPHAWLDANKVPGWERQAAYDEGFARARACFAKHIAKIIPLVEKLIAQGAVSGEEVETSLR